MLIKNNSVALAFNDRMYKRIAIKNKQTNSTFCQVQNGEVR